MSIFVEKYVETLCESAIFGHLYVSNMLHLPTSVKCIKYVTSIKQYYKYIVVGSTKNLSNNLITGALDFLLCEELKPCTLSKELICVK